MAVLRSPTPALSRAARYARDFGGARLNLSYSAAADSEAIEFSQSYSQAKPHVCTPYTTPTPPPHHPYTTPTPPLHHPHLCPHSILLRHL